MATVIDTTNPIGRLAYWIKERNNIRIKKEAGGEPPWTNDPILRRYRFCNVNREDDKVTRWIKHNWRDPHANEHTLWHAMVIARFINWPETLDAIGYPEPWSMKMGDRMLGVLRLRQDRGQKVFTGAYIVSTNGVNISKVTYVLGLFQRAWECKAPPLPTNSLAEAHVALMKIKGIGSFMSAQIIADLKHTPYLRHAEDWFHWAAPGPGSLRGLSRVRGYGTGTTWRTDAFVPELLKLRRELVPHGVSPSICLQDLQNCLCEFDKYERVRLGQGRPRSTYTPHGGTDD